MRDLRQAALQKRGRRCKWGQLQLKVPQLTSQQQGDASVSTARIWHHCRTPLETM